MYRDLHVEIAGENAWRFYYFEGRFDLVRFVKTVQEAGLFVHLRIGPYACAEWNYGSVSDFNSLFQFLAFGYAVPYRPVEDLAFAVARFFEYGGSFQNYYMVRPSDPVHQQLGKKLEAHVYYKHSNDCAAFLANYDSDSDANVTFNGNTYFLPAWSVSILADCKNVIFNTAKVVTQRHIGDALFSRSTIVDGNLGVASPWSCLYVEAGQDKEHFLNIGSLGHAALVFVNKRFVAFGYGNHDDASFSLTQKISLEEGNNTLDVLSMLIGVQNYGPWFDVQGAGIHSVFLVDLHKTKKDLSSGKWTYQVGLEGEYLGLDKVSLANSLLWSQGTSLPVNKSLIWYHIPRTWVHPGENLLVLHEELGGDPSQISLLTRTGQDICSIVSEDDPPPADSWKPNLEFMSQTPEVRLTCEHGWHIAAINFASFGTPEGKCGTFTPGNCHADMLTIVQKACIGQEGCSIPISAAKLGDPCPGVVKRFVVEALCSE
ncbi:hypothetical protein POTOM_039380 [Populus tomentosa]|uniref:SUEL-type lectin domain-containing protein n=1 Tax=Populus tomentosa TaxID=118781 RepID=A0A8X7YRS7_POPTO|nr:hypothetical protein POTOM_039380 [Populus tomentosa]